MTEPGTLPSRTSRS